jgi:phospholipid/cholesterol/gamma-HCH transport system permease protein
MAEIGNHTLPFAALVSIFVGAALALETGPQLAQFGLEQNIGGIVSIGMIRELGPVMTSMLVAGRVGSAMTAEIGSMSVYHAPISSDIHGRNRNVWRCCGLGCKS